MPMSDSFIRVMIVDDHALFRAGVKSMLARRDDVDVVAEANSAEQALASLPTAQVDVVLLDLSLPGMCGVAAIPRLLQLRPRLKIVVLSMHRDEEYVGQTLHAGARGYVVKDCTIDELALAIRSAWRGDLYISPAVSQLFVAPFLQRVPADDGLTPRQRQVLQLAAQGLAARDIAARLGVSVKTVETHRALMMEKLGLDGTAALVLYAVRAGMIAVCT